MLVRLVVGGDVGQCRQSAPPNLRKTQQKVSSVRVTDLLAVAKF